MKAFYILGILSVLAALGGGVTASAFAANGAEQSYILTSLLVGIAVSVVLQGIASASRG